MKSFKLLDASEHVLSYAIAGNRINIRRDFSTNEWLSYSVNGSSYIDMPGGIFTIEQLASVIGFDR